MAENKEIKLNSFYTIDEIFLNVKKAEQVNACFWLERYYSKSRAY